VVIQGICIILEKDKGYRYRFQDIMMCLNSAMMLLYPNIEISRLIDIYSKREGRAEYKGFSVVAFILRFTPNIREMVVDFTKEANLGKFKMDRYDFWACLSDPAYNYGGLTLDARIEIKKRL
jgi:hypothetical protein